MTNAASVEEKGGLVNTFTGLLSKSIDTALDIATLRAQGKRDAAIGTVYPTGQVNPAAAASAQEQNQQQAALTNKPIKWGLVIGGGIAAVVVIAYLVKKA